MECIYTITSIEEVNHARLIEYLPKDILSDAADAIAWVYGEKKSLPIGDLMRGLYGIISFDAYEGIFNVICTEM